MGGKIVRSGEDDRCRYYHYSTLGYGSGGMAWLGRAIYWKEVPFLIVCMLAICVQVVCLTSGYGLGWKFELGRM